MSGLLAGFADPFAVDRQRTDAECESSQALLYCDDRGGDFVRDVMHNQVEVGRWRGGWSGLAEEQAAARPGRSARRHPRHRQRNRPHALVRHVLRRSHPHRALPRSLYAPSITFYLYILAYVYLSFTRSPGWRVIVVGRRDARHLARDLHPSSRQRAFG